MPPKNFEHSAYRFDASESAFFSRQLEHVATGTYDIKYPNLKGRTFLPTDSSVSNGAETFTFRVYDMVGVAKIIANYSDDVPRADVKGTEVTSRIRGIASSYGFSLQEARAAAFAKVPLDQKKGAACRRAMEETLDGICQTGNTANGLAGLLNQSNAISYTIPNGVSGSQSWNNKTSDEILLDMHGIVNNMISTTKEVEQPDTMLLPLAKYLLISTRRMGDGSDVTILDYFLRTSRSIKDVQPWYACDTAGSGSGTRMCVYRKDPNAVALIMPQEFEQLPPQEDGFETVILCHMRTGGVVAFYPLSISYGDLI